MTWWLSHAAKQLRDQVNSTFRERDRSSDGALGDPAHAARKSDHNPDPTSEPPGVVRAIDLDEDFTTHDDPRADELVRQLVTLGPSDERLSYVIHEGRIYGRAAGWDPAGRAYTGPNAHEHHVHVSFTPAGDLDRRAFALPILATVDPTREAQTLLALLYQRLVADGYQFPGVSAGRVDGLLGPRTATALRVYQGMRALPITGKPDGATLDSLRAEPRSSAAARSRRRS